jgi:uncharacterized protein (TIGR00725 family)
VTPLQTNANGNLPSHVAELLRRLAAMQAGPARWMQPVGIIGPGDGGQVECLGAYQVANALARAGMAIVCGGRGGVMEAASRGAHDAAGVVVGILPEDDVRAANRYLTVAIPTGMGEMRNALIARSSACLVAIGGGMGTISEMALGLKCGKQVFALHAGIALPGMKNAQSVEQLVEWTAAWLLDGPGATLSD